MLGFIELHLHAAEQEEHLREHQSCDLSVLDAAFERARLAVEQWVAAGEPVMESA